MYKWFPIQIHLQQKCKILTIKNSFIMALLLTTVHRKLKSEIFRYLSPELCEKRMGDGFPETKDEILFRDAGRCSLWWCEI
jgi:hypothetical protein